jgi:hypothetical protein
LLTTIRVYRKRQGELSQWPHQNEAGGGRDPKTPVNFPFLTRSARLRRSGGKYESLMGVAPICKTIGGFSRRVSLALSSGFRKPKSPPRGTLRMLSVYLNWGSPFTL